MKNPINKRVYRQIKSKPFKVIPIFISLVFIVVFASSFFISQESIKNLYYSQIENGKVEDGNFTTIYELSDDLKEKIENLSLKLYDNFYFESDAKDNKSLRVFKNRKHINEAQIYEGRLAQSEDEIAISANYARANDLKLNDSIEIGGKIFKITGLFSVPDYSSLLKNRDDLVMDIGYFGVCLLSDSGFKKFSNEKIIYNYSYHTDDNLNEREAKEKLKEISKVINKENLMIDGVTRFDNKRITFIIDDMGGDVPTMTLTSILLFIAIAFISAVQIKSLIEEEAPIIGTLLASGYRKKELLLNYMAMPLFVALISSLVGNIISYTYLYKKYAALYYASYDLPKFEVTFTARSFLITSFLPMIIYLVINYLVISRSLQFSPVNFLRRNLKKTKKNTRLKLKNISFLRKFKTRIILSNKLNFIALLFGVFLANLILVFSLSAKPVFSIYAKNMQNEMKYNHIYFVKQKENKDVNADVATVVKSELVDSDDKEIQFYGVEKNSKYKNLKTEDLKEDEVIVSSGFSKRFNLEKSDTFRIRDSYNSKIKNLKIKEIDKDNSLFQIFTSREALNKIIEKDKDYFNSYMSDERLEISKDNLITELNKNEMSKFMDHFLDSFGVVFSMLIVVSLTFYFILTSMISSLIIDKSKVNLTYLKIFGFKDSEISKVYISTIFLILIVYQIILIPILDKLIKYMLFIAMQKFDAYFDIPVPKSIFILAYVLSIVTFVLVHLVEKIKISRLNMVKELKIING